MLFLNVSIIILQSCVLYCMAAYCLFYFQFNHLLPSKGLLTPRYASYENSRRTEYVNDSKVIYWVNKNAAVTENGYHAMIGRDRFFTWIHVICQADDGGALAILPVSPQIGCDDGQKQYSNGGAQIAATSISNRYFVIESPTSGYIVFRAFPLEKIDFQEINTYSSNVYDIKFFENLIGEEYIVFRKKDSLVVAGDLPAPMQEQWESVLDEIIFKLDGGGLLRSYL